jgi:glycosyltransferase involved in cell wall biosynthesis
VTAATVHVVLPGAIDDPSSPSGGNRYDRQVCTGLLATRDVHEIAVAGTWPHPSAASRNALAKALTELPADATVLLDGLVASPVPDVIEPAAERLKLVVLVHLPLGDETGLSRDEADALSGLERRTLHAAAAVIATSAGAARRLSDLYGLPPSKVHVALPGVEPAPLTTPSEDGGRLLCVAAVTPRKGQDVLVDALAQCADLAWTCTCVGSLDRAPGFARQVQTGRTRFVGPKTGADLDAAYAGADLFVLPSRAETYGMVVTEALARGLPVLATAVDGVPEALGAAPDGTLPGLLVPPDDPAALAAAIRRWLTDAGWRETLRDAAGKRRQTLKSWDETVRSVSEVLDR